MMITMSFPCLTAFLIGALVAPGQAFVSPLSKSPDAANNGFVVQHPRHQSLVAPLPVVGGIKQNDMKEEAEAALRAAQAALQKGGLPSKDSSAPSITISDEALAATAGGALLGAGLGVAASIGQPELVDSVVPAAAIVGGGAAFAIGTQDDEKGSFVRRFVGKPTQFLGSFIVKKVKDVMGSVAASVASIPEKVADAFKRQVERTKAEIMSIPDKVMYFLKLKVDEAAEEVKRIPQKLSNAAVSAAEDFKQELQATPGRVADSTKRALEQAAEETKLMINEAVEDVRTLPNRKVEELVTFLEGGEEAKTFTPKPPKTPPPAALFSSQEVTYLYA